MTEDPTAVSRAELKKRETKNPIEVIHEIETPFSQLMRNFYGDNPETCQISCYFLSRVVSQISGVPLRRETLLGMDSPAIKDIEREHIELDVGFYEAPPEPGKEPLMFEQTYIKYFDGKGNIFYIDPTLRRIMAKYGRAINDGQPAETIIAESFPESEFDSALEAKFHIHKFDPNYPNIRSIAFFRELREPVTRTGAYLRLLALLNESNQPLPSNYAEIYGLRMNPEPRQFDFWIIAFIKAYREGRLLSYDWSTVDWMELDK